MNWESTPDPDVEIILVAAVAENRVIGVDGEMPWHLPEDLAHFKETTMGHPVIMGRRTYESIESTLGGPLPGRTNVVLSRSNPEVPEEVYVVESIDEAISIVSDMGVDRCFVVGGATIYEQFLPFADRLVLTELEASYEGDTFFPEFDRTRWSIDSRDDRDGFAFVEYVRRCR